jgi:FdhE protein
LTTTGTDELWQLALAKWAGIAHDFPDLAPALTLQQAMLRLLLDAREGLDDSRAPLPDTTPPAILEKWTRGLPAIRNEAVLIPAPLVAVLPALCDVLAQGGAGDSAAHIGQALASGEIDGGSLLRVSLARSRKAIRTSSLHHGFSPDLVWVIGELGSAPLAHYLQTRWLEVPELKAAIGKWDRGYCPCCGSWPALLETVARRSALREGSLADHLRCSYCAATWELSSHRCVYCANADDRFVVAAPDVDQPGRRIELCGACGGYTKVVTAEALTPFPLIAIEDLATMDLDEGAMARGYHRPDLFDLDTIDPPTTPNCG